MTRTVPIKKLTKTAIYTSLILIGIVAVAPHAIAIRSVSIAAFFKGVFILTVFVGLIWTLNIGLVFLTERRWEGKRPSYLRYVLSYFISLTSIAITGLCIKPISSHPNGAVEHLYAILVLGFILNTIVLIIQDLILVREKKAQIELENAALIIKNVEATNQQLKQQIHPHFLFNSLNTLKSLIHNHPDKAEVYLVMLSNFLRASLSSQMANTAVLKEEIKLCEDYLSMQGVRFGEALRFTIEIPDEIRNTSNVPVFSILPLLENAVKHNSMTVENPLTIEINYVDGWITTSNNIQEKASIEPSTGLGLENLTERYRILSGDTVIIEKNEKRFSVSIKTL